MPLPIVRGGAQAALVAATMLAIVYIRARFCAESQRFIHDEAHTFHMSPACTGPVPRILYVYSDAENLTLPVQATCARNPHFELRLYRPAPARNFVRTHCPHALTAFDMVVPLAYKADMFRYCALYTTGGVYTDDDLEVLLPFEALTRSRPGKLLLIEDGHDINLWSFAPRIVRHRIWNAFIAARKPRSEVLQCALAVSTSNVLMRKGWLEPLELTGPEVLYDCLRKESDAAAIGWYPGHRTSHMFGWNGKILVNHIQQNGKTKRNSNGRWFTSQ